MSKPKSGIDWDNAGGCPFTRLSVFGATQMAQRRKQSNPDPNPIPNLIPNPKPNPKRFSPLRRLRCAEHR